MQEHVALAYLAERATTEGLLREAWVVLDQGALLGTDLHAGAAAEVADPPQAEITDAPPAEATAPSSCT